MANAPAFDDAAQLAKTVPELSIGCHVVLTDGEPVLDAQQLPTLTTASRFRDGMITFAARAMAGRIDADEITAEAAAQIRKIQSSGIAVSHIDTHKHTHLFPKILRPFLRAASASEVGARRDPFGPRLHLRSSQHLARPSPVSHDAEVRVEGRCVGPSRQAVDRSGVGTPDS